MPKDFAQRVMTGACNLSPFRGERMLADKFLGKSVVGSRTDAAGFEVRDRSTEARRGRIASALFGCCGWKGPCTSDDICAAPQHAYARVYLGSCHSNSKGFRSAV